MIARRRPALVIAAVAAVALAIGPTGCDSDRPASPAQVSAGPVSTPPPGTNPHGTTYVNLGDSYSAGTGVTPAVAYAPILCQRSARNFAHVLAAQRGLRLTDVSCAGADTADLESPQYEGIPAQFDAVGAATGIVTILIGGNDNDVFSGAIRSCRAVAAQDPTGAPCRDHHGDSFDRTIETKTYPSLVDAFGQLRAKVPEARILAIGYPWILPPTGGCYPTMTVASGDVPYLRDLQQTLNSAVRRAAQATGVTFVDMAAVSDGHDACQPPERRWIEPMTTSGVGAVHPNAAGQKAIADQVGSVL